MFYGKFRKIRFWYTGPSLQAVLDRLPTAKIIERKRKEYLLEAEVYGDGIKMFLLSQGTWVKVITPEEFVEEISKTVTEVASLYKIQMKYQSQVGGTANGFTSTESGN
jgi:hypothetical protein